MTKEIKVTDQPVKYGKHTLYPGTLGHRRWLMERKNKTLTTGKVDMDAVVEICFAYVTDSLELQKIQGVKAKEVIQTFGDSLTPEAFLVLQAHAEYQLRKFIETEARNSSATPTSSKSAEHLDYGAVYGRPQATSSTTWRMFPPSMF